MFRSPLFVASVTLSIIVYFSAWMLPEPLFSKAFAATLTARLALVVGLLELRNIALACLQLVASFAMAGGGVIHSANTAQLVTALQHIARDVCTPGSRLYQLVTKTQQ